VTIPSPLDSKPEARRATPGAWQWVPGQPPLSRGTGTSRRLPPGWVEHKRCVQKRRWGCEAFSPILPGDTSRQQLPGGGVSVAVGQSHDAAPGPVAVLELAQHAGCSPTTDPSAPSHFRDDRQARSNTYLPAIGRGEGQPQPLRSIQAALQGVLLEGAQQPLAEGEGSGCLAVPATCRGWRLLRLQAAGIPVAMARNLEPLAPPMAHSSSDNDPAQHAGEQAKRGAGPCASLERALRFELPLVIS